MRTEEEEAEAEEEEEEEAEAEAEAEEKEQEEEAAAQVLWTVKGGVAGRVARNRGRHMARGQEVQGIQASVARL